MAPPFLNAAVSAPLEHQAEGRDLCHEPDCRSGGHLRSEGETAGRPCPGTGVIRRKSRPCGPRGGHTNGHR